MSLDHVASDERGVAGLKRSRHSVLGLYLIELGIVDIVQFDAKTVRLQVTHPLGAAASGRAPVNRNAGPGGGRRCIDDRSSYKS